MQQDYDRKVCITDIQELVLEEEGRKQKHWFCRSTSFLSRKNTALAPYTKYFSFPRHFLYIN